MKGLRLALRRPRAVTTATLLLLALVGCEQQQSADPRTEPPRVRVATVTPAEPESRTFTGVISARVESDIGFRVDGKILSRLVDVGEQVKQGEPLARLDPVDLTLNAESAAQAVSAARARAKQTEDDERRYRTLRDRGVIAVSRYDEAKAAADAAQADLEAASAEAEVARNATRYSTLVADADGVVMDTFAEPGQVVAAGQTVIRLAQAGPREALVELPETLRPPLGSMAQATLYGLASSGPAALRELSESSNTSTRTYEARYVLGAEFADAPLGATVSVRLPMRGSDANEMLTIPLSALYDAGAGPGVWVVDGDPATVHWQSVDVRVVSDERAGVSGALEPGTRIVAMGAHLLREGDTVRLAGARVDAAPESPQ
ncbi:MAG: efflux RND transporter periplasmic adaptor subunit [Salinicola sp.]|uniref:efflux RND transporter periplasmic adaptor subunit n=1 Tax=Salinicola sp. TaxID=1978524 RepID=UPI001D92701B|nr:efflux RND transporter periplasmic adaptor subunit [Salinicola sp.]NRB57021.1 efflux RND transporter periplasmic adaptor subunit [Salinicola sp.]